MKESNMVSMKFLCPRYHEGKIRRISQLRKVPMSRLIAIAVDNEISKEENKFEYDLSLPTSVSEEFEFADEAGRIADFLRGVPNGTGLDIIMLLRYEIGIPDRDKLLAGFKDLLERKFIEELKPRPNKARPVVADDYFIYKIKTNETAKRKRNKSSKYGTYLKLKKEFENE